MRRTVILTYAATTLFALTGAVAAQDTVNGRPAHIPLMRTGQGFMPCGSCFAPKVIPSTVTIAPAREPGEPLELSGTVYQPDGVHVVPRVTLFVFHTDANGLYNSGPGAELNPRLYGWIRTDSLGHYRFHTIRPAPYPSRDVPAHIHLHAWSDHCSEWFLDEYLFADDPLLPRSAARSADPFSKIVSLTRDSSGWHGKRNLRLPKPC